MRQLPSADIRSQDYKVGARMISLGLGQANQVRHIDKSHKSLLLATLVLVEDDG